MPHVILGDLSPSSVNMALLIARVVLGAVFLAHGINHIYGGGKIEGTGALVRLAGHAPGDPPRLDGQPGRDRRRRACSCSGC